MMVLSRLWYVVLALLLGIATYVVFLAVGQYNRRNGVAMEEEVASDGQTVGWALQIDARRRLDALLIGAVDKGLQDSLQSASGKDTIPKRSKDDGRVALTAIMAKIPAEFRPDALFEVDHDGRVVAQVGYDAANAFPDFELGGYPVVFDALHGFLRDDTWVLGGRPYGVVARPVEADSTQPPLGAIVALKAMDKKYAQDISKLTRTNIAFFAGGQRVASAVVSGFDEGKMSAIDSDMLTLPADKAFATGHSNVRMAGDELGAVYTRFVGDAASLGAGFVVVRSQTTIGGPLGFLNGADDKDKQSVNIVLIAAVVAIGLGLGILLSILEQTLPLRQMEKQAGALRRGELDYLQVAKFRGGYRGIAENINAGIERVLEKGGDAVRKPADLESILGPVPAQPAMSAFSFPLPDAAPPPGRGAPASPAFPQVPPATSPAAFPVVPPLAVGGPPAPANPPLPRPHPPARPGGPVIATAPTGPTVQSPRASSPAFPPAGPPIPAPASATPAARPGNVQIALDDSDGDGPTMASAAAPVGAAMLPGFLGAPDSPHAPPAAPKGAKSAPDAGVKLGMGGPPPPAAGKKPGIPGAPGTPPVVATHTMMGMGLEAQNALGGVPRPNLDLENSEDESTVIARAPSELLAAASGPAKAVTDETAEWMGVYDEFLRTKKQCDEPTDGLSFEKFQNTLRKNRDALVQRHQCKRVRFSVYIKDGRASLKATPVKE